MKKCNHTKVKTQAPTIKPTLLTRLTPSRKTLNKWVKWLLQSFKIEISIGGTFLWIAVILIWITIFPQSLTQLKIAIDLVTPLL